MEDSHHLYADKYGMEENLHLVNEGSFTGLFSGLLPENWSKLNESLSRR